MITNKDDCECGLDETGDWSDKVFDRYGCDCEPTNKEDDRRAKTNKYALIIRYQGCASE